MNFMDESQLVSSVREYRERGREQLRHVTGITYYTPLVTTTTEGHRCHAWVAVLGILQYCTVNRRLTS